MFSTTRERHWAQCGNQKLSTLIFAFGIKRRRCKYDIRFKMVCWGNVLGNVNMLEGHPAPQALSKGKSEDGESLELFLETLADSQT